MGPLGGQEIVFILILAFVLFGPKKLPEIGRTIGKAINEFRRASSELKETFNKEMQNLERETESLKEVTNQYQYDTHNYDYSSYGTHADGVPVSETEYAAIPSSESASATQGAELPPAEPYQEPTAYEPEVVAQPVAEPDAVSASPVHAVGHESAVAPAEYKA